MLRCIILEVAVSIRSNTTQTERLCLQSQALCQKMALLQITDREHGWWMVPVGRLVPRYTWVWAIEGRRTSAGLQCNRLQAISQSSLRVTHNWGMPVYVWVKQGSIKVYYGQIKGIACWLTDCPVLGRDVVVPRGRDRRIPHLPGGRLVFVDEVLDLLISNLTPRCVLSSREHTCEQSVKMVPYITSHGRIYYIHNNDFAVVHF